MPITFRQPVVGDRPLRTGSFRHLVTLSEIGWTDAQVMTVDLQAQGVKTDLLTAGAVARGSALSQQVREAGAVAGVNADFFDISNSNAAIGPRSWAGAAESLASARAGRAACRGPPRPPVRACTLEATRDPAVAARAPSILNAPDDVGANCMLTPTRLLPGAPTAASSRSSAGATQRLAEVLVPGRARSSSAKCCPGRAASSRSDGFGARRAATPPRTRSARSGARATCVTLA